MGRFLKILRIEAFCRRIKEDLKADRVIGREATKKKRYLLANLIGLKYALKRGCRKVTFLVADSIENKIVETCYLVGVQPIQYTYDWRSGLATVFFK